MVHTNTYFTNLIPVARVLQASDRYAPQFWFVRSYPTLADDLATCRRERIAARAAHDGDGWLARVERRAPVIAHTARLVTTRQRVRRWLRELGARLMVLPADNRYDLAVYVRAAHDEGVPVAVVPAFMAATREWAEAMRGVPDYSLDRLANRVAARLYPRWRYEHEGTRMVALPASQLLPRQWFGLTPPLPWTLHSGHADAIAIESEAMKRYCVREGLPEERMTVTGSVDHDLMSRRLADPHGDRTLVTALPPDQLYGRGRKDCEFQNYNDLVEFWISSLAEIRGWRTIVSLHPSVKRESMRHLEALGVTIADEHVSALIPQCDVYVASVSATIQWAIACGKPVINYDVYRYHYPDYVGVDGVVAMETRDEFRAALARVTEDATYRAELAENQRRHAPDWGVLDGHAGDRLLALFDRLTR